jgi:nucleotide-binding universal stress UspA family protein
VKKQPAGGGVVVGLDGGENYVAVLDAALNQARRSGSILRVVHAIGPEGPPSGSIGSDARQHRRQEIAGQLHRQLTTLTNGEPVPTVEYDVRHGDPATILLDAGRTADLIVLGTRGSAHREPFPLSLVSQDVAVQHSARFCWSP